MDSSVGLITLDSLPKNWLKYFSSVLGASALVGLLPSVAMAELSPEHKQRVRGEMREIWSKMTPEERDFLQREYASSRFEVEPTPAPFQKPPVRGSEKPRQLTTEDHHNLRRQLKDISADGKH